MGGDSRPLLPRPAFVLVTDSARRRDRSAENTCWIEDVVREAVLGGVNIVQLREKHLSRAELLEAGLHIRDALGDRALLFVNGDVEAAATLRADGIHLPEDGPPIAVVRDRVGPQMLISRAVHSVDGAVAAEREGADIIQIGTTFASASKPGVAPLGLHALRAAVAAVRVPVIAIGGITQDNAASVLLAGASGVAVIGAIFDAAEPRAAAAGLMSAITGAVAARPR